jgi:HTH-type transcriptional regulator, competence development regulator
MRNFGDTLRELRVAQKMGLRETAVAVDISPSYLSRIERNKENPPKPEVIKALAKILAADPDVLFRLSSSTDPEIASMVKENAKIRKLMRLFIECDPTEEQLREILLFAEKKLAKTNP